MLKEKMKEHKLTQTALAKMIGAKLDQSSVCRILKGEKKPTLIQALRIEEELGIPVRYWGAVANDNMPKTLKDET